MTVSKLALKGTPVAEWVNPCPTRWRLGGAKVLGKLSVPGRPTNLDTCNSRARTCCACSIRGWGLFRYFFSRLSFSLFFLRLWKTARYRLKYCLQRAVKPETTNQPCPTKLAVLIWIPLDVDFLRRFPLYAVFHYHSSFGSITRNTPTVGMPQNRKPPTHLLQTKIFQYHNEKQLRIVNGWKSSRNFTECQPFILFGKDSIHWTVFSVKH